MFCHDMHQPFHPPGERGLLALSCPEPQPERRSPADLLSEALFTSSLHFFFIALLFSVSASAWADQP